MGRHYSLGRAASLAAIQWRWRPLPIAYFVYALTRGAIEGGYAYPFLDVVKIGWLRTAAIALTMALGFLAGGFVVVGLDGWSARRTQAE
jgi:hypothetical protein